MRRRGRHIEPNDESHSRDRWLISYADLVTLLLALFIVLYAASDAERAQRIASSFAAENGGGNGVLPGSAVPPNDRDKFQKTLSEDPVLLEKTKIHMTRNGLVISLAEAGVFAPGDATLGPEAVVIIRALSDRLKENNFPVRVEGHTDSVPISNAKYSSNWELSTARAANVLQKLVEFEIGPDRLSAAGYGGFQPVADNASPEGRAQNRRVDIVIIDR